ncbi:Mbeg1-like protein [Facklamia languida]
MASVFDYLNQQGQEPLTRLGLNEVDILLLTEATYMMSQHTTRDLPEPYTLRAFYDHLQAHYPYFSGQNPFLITENRLKTLNLLAQSPRYGQLELENLEEVNDSRAQLQFSAVTYRLDADCRLIVYKGTDDTLVGWKEDFNLSYQAVIPAQLEALAYFTDRYDQEGEVDYILSGHSKGGNLAVYAGMEAEFKQWARFKAIYSFDAPGFQKDTLNRWTRSVPPAGRIHQYMPQNAVVGQILYPLTQPQVVESTAFRLLQHDTLTWLVDQDRLSKLQTTSPESDFARASMAAWMEETSPANRHAFFSLFFKLLDQCGLHSLNDLSGHYGSFITAFLDRLHQLPSDQRQILATNIEFFMTHYRSQAVQHRRFKQREFFDRLVQGVRDIRLLK